jgi:hypothetical protein
MLVTVCNSYKITYVTKMHSSKYIILIVKLHLPKLVHTDLTVTKHTLNIPCVFVVEKLLLPKLVRESTNQISI